MSRRVPQPPMVASRRDPERHGFWPALALTFLGMALIGVGAVRSTQIETVEERPAREMDLVRAFAVGGVLFADRMGSAAPPMPTGDPLADAEALARWDAEQAGMETPTWRLRVDPTARTPCPT